MKQQKIKWGDKDINIVELLDELERLVVSPVQTMHEMDGDMFMTDYQKLSKAHWLISAALRQVKGDKE
jgi:hypothetical protein